MKSAAILATAVVPWTDRHMFNEPVFRRQVHAIAGSLTKHIYIFGTAGEGYAVSDDQFETVVSNFWTSSRECGAKPMLGIISLSLSTIIARIEFGRALGFREFQLSLPAWGALNDRELQRFFQETCGRFPDCGFLHYNLARAKRLLTATEYRRFAGEHSNLVAVKASTSDPAVVADLLTLSPRLRFFFTEMAYAIARRSHEVGLLISLASVNHRRAHEFVDGDDARWSADVQDFNTMVAILGERAAGRFHMDGAFDKLLFRFTDPDFPLRLLPPYESATDEDFQVLRSRMPAAWRQ